MNCILVGCGEIGKAILEYYGTFHTIHTYDIKENKEKLYNQFYDILLVAIPYSEKFIDIIKEYKQKFNTNDVIIFSTVAIGTTSQISNAVHSPVEGKHPHLASSIDKWRVFVGGQITECISRFFRDAKKEIGCLPKPEMTEFLNN